MANSIFGVLSSVEPKRVRKTPEARRVEIVAAAAAIALAEGLECITLRRVAEELAVRPGLISHYFAVAEDLVAEAFGAAATAELDELIPAERPPGRALEYLARFLSLTFGDRYDGMSRLWLNARHLSRYRPVLRDRVGHQEARWRDRLSGLIGEGAAAGTFRADDPPVAAIQILVVLDGLGAHANTDPSNRPPAVMTMAVSTAERVLHLPDGAVAALMPGTPHLQGHRDRRESETMTAMPPEPTLSGLDTSRFVGMNEQAWTGLRVRRSALLHAMTGLECFPV